MYVRPRRGLLAAVTSAIVALAIAASTSPAHSNPDHVDPAAMERGDDPTVARILGNRIVDGDQSFRIRRANLHLDLWRTAGGYVVVDNVRHETRHFRLTSVSKTGERTVLARPEWLEGAAVSLNRKVLAWGDAKGELAQPTDVTVVHPDTGRVKAERRFAGRAHVVAVTRSRVLLTKPDRTGPDSTWWWNFRRDTLRKISDWTAKRADLRQDRVVLMPRSSVPTRCHRVAALSKPGVALWRSCDITPHAWSPNGERVLSTHFYFDYPGTDRWVVADADTGERTARVNGRLDWDVAWEDNRHFLTLAQSDAGKAAIIRCTVDATCERASRLWDIPIDPDAYFVAPPVVLASN
jgi:hypothetical protein